MQGEKGFRALIEHSSDPILVLTANGEITYANPSTSRIVGYAIGDLVGLRAFKLIAPEDRDYAMAQFDVLIQETGRTKTAEFRARNKEGKRAWIEVTATNLLEEPSVQGVVVSWRDITDRKRAEKDREQLIAILEATPDIVTMCDLHGRLIYTNKPGRRALQLGEDDDLSNHTITELVENTTRLQLTNEILPVVIHDGGWTGEITALGLDGQEIASLVFAQAHKSPDGSIEFLSMISRDITALRRVLNALQVAAEEWRTTFDGITEGILVLDTERRVLRCNSAMQAFLGLPFKEILGRYCCDLICGFSEGEKGCTALLVLQTKRKETSDLRIAGRWFAITTYPLQSPDNSLTGIVYIMSDTTEQKKSEEALQESEKKVRKLAADSVRAQEEERQWVADEVHDRIAQPLVAVHQQLQALGAATQDDSPTRRLVDRALELQQRAIHETRNIMSDLYLPTLDQYGLVTVIREELHKFHEDTGCQIRLGADYPERPPKYVEGVLYRIFHEALMNVRRHGTGAKVVEVSVKREHDDVSIVVQDDGPGFDVQAVMQSRRYGGLVSMRRRAEILEGTFEVTSDLGQGTKVSFKVPGQYIQSPGRSKD